MSTKRNYNDTFPSRLRHLIDSKRIKIVDLAEKTGIARQRIGSYKDGSTLPDTDTLVKLADALGVTTDYLLGRTEEELGTWSTYYDVVKALNQIIETFYCGIDTDPVIGPDDLCTPAVRIELANNEILYNYYRKYSDLQDTIAKYSDDLIVKESLLDSIEKLTVSLKTVPLEEEHHE